MMRDRADAELLAAVRAATCSAFYSAQTRLPDDVMRALHRASSAESSRIAKGEFSNIMENITRAGDLGIPICQDTGVPVVYLTVSPDVPVTTALYDAIADGVRLATAKVPLRPNVVSPLCRENTGDNTGHGMPAIHLRPGDRLCITVLPKGAGAENMSRIAMLLPTQKDEIARFVVETMLIAEGKPCPPVVLGVGIGSTFDGVAALAKEALLLPIDEMTEFEQILCDAVNELGIGPMGLGGNTTALAVKVKEADCHTASLPVAVNVQCWACRRASVEVPI